ncbi:MAG: S-layer homology domain-containing protein [Peptoniphilus harei]|uniref:S-layer homology domain-containing protein n=1 Tax=Peptoniphilus harei TaxID=54005 RepID=UPI00254E8808|nr:S-layer homology domain-containing protein [Peptoniphilus harei]MDK7754636.1 S-layer homology domain-containing protein [Peptoniphilus harei]MDK7760442.1 S-layer homology domain-containing protein [Peptoniphilus harei]MDK8270232.1 S-layer homology domain-containing protein [Peptoniphilus harei]MDK8338692.1 S-layer homology domain-containing protein [Peptoniphilus harei]
MIKKTSVIFILCLTLLFNSISVFAQATNDKKVSLKLEKTSDKYMEFSIEPKETIDKISGIKTDTVFTHEKMLKNSIGWTSRKKGYAIENGKLYIETIKNKHTITLNLNDGSDLHFILKDGKCESIDLAHPPKGKIHLKLEGYFEGALVGQRKYDAVSASTGAASDNKNSDIKVYGQITEDNEAPNPKAWKELSKSDIEVDKGLTKITLDPKSGMKANFNALDSSITLAGEPKNVGDYPVKVELVDIYGRRATSNAAWFSVSDIESTYLDKVMKDVNTKLKTTQNNKVLFNQEPWYIGYFNENNRGANQSFTVPKNINLWQGSHESGTYGQLGLILPIRENPDKNKFQYRPDEERIPIQNFVLEEGTNLTLVNMKVFSGVNIIVKKGANLNVHDSSIYGRITVDGGRLRINYDPKGTFQGEFGKSSGAKVVSGSSIQGQIILNDGAVLESSYIYSNTNNLTDANKAIKNTRPVVLVKGKAFIKGNVFVKGDESPTGSEANGLPYRGQTGMEIDGGSLTVLKDSNLYVYGGGTTATTSRGGNALVLKNKGKVLGDGGLALMGGTGQTGEGGYAACGDGIISTKSAYLRAGNGSIETPAKQGNIDITKNVIGSVHNGKKGTGRIAEEYPEFWGHSSVPKMLDDEKIGKTLINPNGKDKVEGETPPVFEDKKPGKFLKRVELVTNSFHNKSTQINNRSEDSKAWLEKLAKGEGEVKLGEEKLNLVQNEVLGQKGYKVDGNFLYIYGLKVDDKIDINLDGYVPLSLKAVASNYPKIPYLLVAFKGEKEERPYLPEKEVDISDESVNAAKNYINGITINESALNQAGVNIGKNSSTIDAFKEAIKKAKELANKASLNDEEKKELVSYFTNKFEEQTKNIKLDMNLEDEKVIANKYDNTRLHAKLNDGKVSYSSQLQNLSKDSYPKLTIYRIDKSSYETRQNLDATSGATPRFEDNILDGKYYDIKKLLNNNQDRTSATNNKYEIDIKENDIKRDFPETKLLKIVFSVELANGIEAKSSDFVFLNDTKPEDKPSENPSTENNNTSTDNNTSIVEEKDPIKEESNKIIAKPKIESTGHYEYRLTKNYSPTKVKHTKKTSQKSFIAGYPNGLFKPDSSVTRAEAAQMLWVLENATASNLKADFKDAKDSWYNQALNYTISKGMLLAKDGNIRPDVPMTRGEFVRMLYPLLADKSGGPRFNDIAGHEFEAAILRASSNGIIKGYPDGSFKPDGKVTRAETVTMFNKLSNRYLTLDDLKKNASKIKEFSDVQKSHWAYLQIMSSVNYPIINEVTETYYTYKDGYEESWDKVWVENSNEVTEDKDQNNKPDSNAKKDYIESKLYDKTSNVNIEGKITKDAKLVVVDKSTTKDGKVTITVPETILKDYKTLKPAQDKLYEIVKSFDIKILGDYQGKLKISLPVGEENNGRRAIIKHLSKNGLKTYTSTVEKSSVSFEVDSLSPFVVIIEKDKVDKELVNLKKQLQEKIDLAKAKDETKFTKKSFDALKAEIAKADSLKDSNDNEALKVALKDLQNSLDSLITIGDSSILEKKLEEALKLTKDESYTEDSRKTLENFLNRFAGYDFDNATEDDIKYDLKLVEEAVNKLVKKPSQVIVEVLVNKGGSSSDNLKGIIGKTFADLTSDSGSYKIEDPSISGKVFLGWKINDDSEILSSDALKSKVITQDMVKDGRIKISAEFNDEVKPSQEDAKTPKFTLEKKNKAIAIDRNNEDTKTWLNLLKGSTVTLSIYLSGEKLNFTTTNSLERGYYVYTNSSLGVRGINIGDIVKIIVPGYKDVFVKAEKFGRSYNLVQIENPETKENNNPSSENNNVQPSEGKNPKPNTQLKKIIFAESENRKIRLKKDHPDNGDWLSQIEEKALVKKLENNTFVDLNKGNIKIYNKTSTKSISIYNLKAGDIIKISLDGFEDVYLKAIKNGQSYQLVQIEKPNL